ncbi:MAG: type II secretion system minor pseudopilin GspK, partial [Pseudomonadota bacterium]|nr:type II secretion system minor pseudopilin GspK [Pseudomonadota bacterium]
MPMLSKQRGVALLTILVMVAMATILASSLMMKQQRMVRESSVLIRQNQAMQYALAGERFLIELLAADEKSSGSSDHLQEVWAQPTPPYPVEDGFVMGELVDQSGRFNLNNLYHDGEPDKTAFEILGRLLQQAGLSADLADAILDWQDPDELVNGAGGAEDSYYLGQQPA